MAAPWARDLAPLVYTDFDDIYATVQIAQNSTARIFAPTYNPQVNGVTVGLGYPLKPYSQVCIASLAQAWDAAGNGFLKWSLLVNGAIHPQYANVSFVTAPPFGDAIYLPQPLWVPANASVEFLVTLGGAAAPVNFTGRLIAYYFLQDPNLLKSIRASQIRVQGPRHVGRH
jgi:hypothetical protein